MVTVRYTPMATIAASSTALTAFCRGYVSGRPGISSCSLAKAIRLPAKLTEPIRQLSMIAQVMSGEAVPLSTAERKSAAAMSAALPPPMPLNNATICGIAVMRTVRAESAPMTVPTAITGTMSGQFDVPLINAAVMPSTSSMPTAATRLPVRAVFGERSSWMTNMKLIDVSM